MKLYESQLKALENIRNGSILCGDTGSGKSLTALAYYYLQMGGSYDFLKGGEYVPMDDREIKDLYIITVAKKRDKLEWEEEMGPFLLSTHKDVNLYCNTVVVDSWNNIPKYTDVKGAFFIFDEQRVVGNGAWAKSFIKIAAHNNWILLSATPGDKWEDYIPVFIANGFYKTKKEFVHQHIVYKPFMDFPSIDRYLDTGRLIRLRNRILVDMEVDRHTVQNHIDILADYDRTAYGRLYKDRWNVFKNSPIKNASELCYCLRRCVNQDESRQVQVLSIIEKKNRAIIFYNFDYELEILRNLYYGEDVEVAEWNSHKHQPIPESDKWVYLVQYTAGAEGWNCISTDTIIFYSQNYSYKMLKQACGRIDRINTKYIDLYYYHIKSKAPIDIMIGRALKQKKKFNEKKFAGDYFD